ncbi:MAG: hypothetical protein KAQ94_09825 [Arcobacteraceae bacterium]|nr:hypothetical protein [Arcobacteraceae bacterium]
MNESFFLVVLIILMIIYVLKHYITKLINHNIFTEEEGFKLKSKYISYFLFFILSATLIIGMLLGTKTKKTYKNVSEGFEKVRTKDDGRPSPMFDIDTYW